MRYIYPMDKIIIFLLALIFAYLPAYAGGNWVNSSDCYVLLYLEEDIDSGLSLCHEQFKAGDGRSGYWLGTYYYYEKEDKERGLDFYTRSAEKGDERSLFMLGMIYLTRNQDFAKGIGYMEKAAQKDFGDAQFFYAHLLDNSNEGVRNVPLAWEYYNKSADNGNVEAMMVISTFYLYKGISGECLQEGDEPYMALQRKKYAPLNIKCDEEKALTYLQRAAELGSPEAINRLAKFYMEKENISEALHWYARLLQWDYKEYEKSEYRGIIPSMSERKIENLQKATKKRLESLGLTNDITGVIEKNLSSADLFIQYGHIACGYNDNRWYHKC